MGAEENTNEHQGAAHHAPRQLCRRNSVFGVGATRLHAWGMQSDKW